MVRWPRCEQPASDSCDVVRVGSTAAIIGALSAWLFLLWTLAYALATRMPTWTATLVVAVVMAAAAAVLIMGGIRRINGIHPIPERTVESVKENLEWMKQPTK